MNQYIWVVSRGTESSKANTILGIFPCGLEAQNYVLARDSSVVAQQADFESTNEFILCGEWFIYKIVKVFNGFYK